MDGPSEHVKFVSMHTSILSQVEARDDRERCAEARALLQDVVQYEALQLPACSPFVYRLLPPDTALLQEPV